MQSSLSNYFKLHSENQISPSPYYYIRYMFLCFTGLESFPNSCYQRLINWSPFPLGIFNSLLKDYSWKCYLSAKLNFSAKATEFRWAVLSCQQLAISIYIISNFRLKIRISWERLFSGSASWQVVGNAMPGLLHCELCILWVVSARLTDPALNLHSASTKVFLSLIRLKPFLKNSKCLTIAVGLEEALPWLLPLKSGLHEEQSHSNKSTTTTNSQEPLPRSQKKYSILQH